MVEGHRAQFGSIFHWPGELGGGGRMNLGGTRALVMIPALLLIMSGLWQGIFPLCLFLLIYKMQTIHFPRAVATRTASSQETELSCHMQLIKRAQSQFLLLASILWAEEENGTLKENTLSVFITLRHQIAVHLTSLRGMTNIFLSTGLGFWPTFRLFLYRAYFDLLPTESYFKNSATWGLRRLRWNDSL